MVSVPSYGNYIARCLAKGLLGRAGMSSYRIALGALLLSATTAQADVAVSFTTKSHGGNFSPRNIGAVWVEDSAGAFVKTIDRWAGTRKSHLVGWIAKAGNADVDAVSGATRSSHTGTLTANWDFKNKAGTTMPDGTYKIRMELADSNSSLASQNDQGTFMVVKNTTASTQTNVTSGGFTATIAFTPAAVPATCNNGTLDPGEKCDPKIANSCPTSCPAAADACKPAQLVGAAASCTAECAVQPITACADDDGCCAAGCDASTDNDCDPGNGSGSGSGNGNQTGGCSTGTGGGTAALAALSTGLLARRRRR